MGTSDNRGKWATVCLALLVAAVFGLLPHSFAGEANGAAALEKSGAVWRVKPAADGGNDDADGQSWGAAFATIHRALNASVAGDEIWVAAGAYTRTPSGKEAVVVLKAGVSLYGGFAGTETDLSQRDLAANVTRIDGQGSYRCVSGANDARIDGFTIQNGYRSVGKQGDKWDLDDYDGGGMYNREASPVVANCLFVNNRASANGGGMGNRFGSPTVVNCVFVGNISGGGVNGGGGMHNYASSPEVVHCTFYGNQGGYAFGGMQNEADEDSSTPSSPIVRNSIFWGNPGAGQIGSLAGANPDGIVDVTYSCVQGGFSGEGNISADPAFLDAASHDLRLGIGSPCIDSANAANASAADILGALRPQGGGYDMGAYEGGYESEEEGEGEGEGEGEAPPDPVYIKGPYRVEEGKAVTLRPSRSFSAAALVEWRRNNTLLPWAVDLELHIPHVTAAHEGVYVLTVVDEDKAIYVSPPFTLRVLPEGSLPAGSLMGLGVLALLLSGASLARMHSKQTR